MTKDNNREQMGGKSRKFTLSGFTIVRNIIRYDYPVVESIKSLLPLVDEFVVAVGESEDETEELIRSIDSPKLRIIYREWDESIQTKGKILSIETNVALDEIKSDWGFYLQADEVVHEDDYVLIEEAIVKAEKKKLKAVSFQYRHFKGDYESINPWAYGREIRLVKSGSGVVSVGDACTFHEEGMGKRPAAFKSDARIFHYGWVKSVENMVKKQNAFERLYHGEDSQSYLQLADEIYEDVKICRVYRGGHPQVMKEKIANFPSIPRKKNRWCYWELYKKLLKYGWV